MYLALSYYNRLIDGRNSVSFLIRVREMTEDLKEKLFEGNNQAKILINI